jgi:hypothetical protein
MKPVRTKPGYTTTRQALWLSSALAWGAIYLIIVGAFYGVSEAADLAGITIPSMVVLISAMLGIHRFSGSMDMRTIARHDRQGESE